MRSLGLICIVCLSIAISGCGNVFIRGAVNTNAQTVNGTVSFVQFTVVVDGSNVSTQVTVVTLATNLGPSTFNFCGDQRDQFPLNGLVQATFMPSQPCSNLLSVVIKID